MGALVERVDHVLAGLPVPLAQRTCAAAGGAERAWDTWHMAYLLLKAAISGLIVAAASELARRSSLAGAILLSLPLTSILALIWLHRDASTDTDQLIALSNSIALVVLPSVLLFVVFSAMLRGGVSFAWSLLAACVVMVAGYGIYIWALRRVGVDL